MASNLWSIATTEAGLAVGFLQARKIPKPFTAPYKDHAVLRPQGDGGQSRHGAKNVIWMFNRLTSRQYYDLQQIIDLALSAAPKEIYLVTHRDNGSAGGWDWIDIKGIPRRIENNAIGPVSSNRAPVHSSLELHIRNVTVLNAPSDHV